MLAEEGPLRYDIVDLAEVNLPFLDEPLKPALGDYAHEHTKAWSRLISGYQGFVFVFPVQLGVSGPAEERPGLPLPRVARQARYASITYGTRGGGKGADQIHQVFEGVHLRPLDARVEVAIADDQVGQDWRHRPRRHDAALRQADPAA